MNRLFLIIHFYLTYLYIIFYFRNVLELVLQGCKGDVVKAIEHFLSAQEPSGTPGLQTPSNSEANTKIYHTPSSRLGKQKSIFLDHLLSHTYYKSIT